MPSGSLVIGSTNRPASTSTSGPSTKFPFTSKRILESCFGMVKRNWIRAFKLPQSRPHRLNPSTQFRKCSTETNHHIQRPRRTRTTLSRLNLSKLRQLDNFASSSARESQRNTNYVSCYSMKTTQKWTVNVATMTDVRTFWTNSTMNLSRFDILMMSFQLNCFLRSHTGKACPMSSPYELKHLRMILSLLNSKSMDRKTAIYNGSVRNPQFGHQVPTVNSPTLKSALSKIFNFTPVKPNPIFDSSVLIIGALGQRVPKLAEVGPRLDQDGSAVFTRTRNRRATWKRANPSGSQSLHVAAQTETSFLA